MTDGKDREPEINGSRHSKDLRVSPLKVHESVHRDTITKITNKMHYID